MHSIFEPLAKHQFNFDEIYARADSENRSLAWLPEADFTADCMLMEQWYGNKSAEAKFRDGVNSIGGFEVFAARDLINCELTNHTVTQGSTYEKASGETRKGKADLYYYSPTYGLIKVECKVYKDFFSAKEHLDDTGAHEANITLCHIINRDIWCWALKHDSGKWEFFQYFTVNNIFYHYLIDIKKREIALLDEGLEPSTGCYGALLEMEQKLQHGNWTKRFKCYTISKPKDGRVWFNLNSNYPLESKLTWSKQHNNATFIHNNEKMHA